MKPPAFRYHDPSTVAEATALLAQCENAKLLAGGQSLMPMLNMRYVLPDDVIDLNTIAALSFLREADDGFAIGAMTRQRDLEFSEMVAARCPLMREAILQVGHRQTRNRGTVGGSLCHLDPSAELVTVAAVLDATIRIAGPRAERAVPFGAFPAGYMTPALEPAEMVVSVQVPCWGPGHGYAFVEFARRHGDFAIASAAALLEEDEDGTIRRAALAIGGVEYAPVRLSAAEQALVGQSASEDAFRAAAEHARALEAMDDIHAPASYRRQLAVVLARRALARAHERTGQR